MGSITNSCMLGKGRETENAQTGEKVEIELKNRNDSVFNYYLFERTLEDALTLTL